MNSLGFKRRCNDICDLGRGISISRRLRTVGFSSRSPL